MRMHYERVITAVAFMAEFFSTNTLGKLIRLNHRDSDKKKIKIELVPEANDSCGGRRRCPRV